MFKNYLKIAFRNLYRHKAFSLINILGLAIGMACTIMILLWVNNELGYDRFNKNAENIYRVTCKVNDLEAAVTPAPFSPYLNAKMPSIKKSVRTSKYYTHVLEYGNNKFEEQNILYADPGFLEMFNYPLIKGDKKNALKDPEGILITQKIALKYFGNENPIGKILRRDNTDNLRVAGILADIPANSHLQFDCLIPMEFLARTNNDLKENRWTNFNFYTYLQTDEKFLATTASINSLNKEMNTLYAGNNKEFKVDFFLQPLTRIHLHSNYLADVPGHGNFQYVNIFTIIAIFVLGVACINFMNLATARSARRAKEVGLRKAIGARRIQVIWQFLGESTLISLIALVISIGIVAMLLPAFNQLAGKAIALDLADGKIVSFMLIIALATGLVSGSYPALFLSGFRPVKVLKGNTSAGAGNTYFRNTLVIAQFVISIVLLVGTAVVYNQLHFIRNRNLGFDKESLLCMPITGELYSKYHLLRTTLQQDPLTSDFSIVSDLPVNLISGTLSIDWQGKDPKSQPLFYALTVDENFIKVFKTALLSGRSFSPQLKTDSSNYVLNEKAVQAMGLNAKTAIGKSFTLWGVKGNIIGVVKDFNFKPVQEAIEPVMLRLNYGDWVVVKAKSGSTEATIKSMARISHNLNPYYPFSYRFLDDDINNLYKGEQQMGKLFNVFAIIAIFISCLGLYGLSAFMAEQRNKEIGVRKVLGATMWNIVYLLSTNFTRLLAVSMLIAVPLSLFAMNKWLGNFAYRITINWSIPVIACIAALMVAALTVSYESIKAALSNPVKSLRTE